MKSSAQKNSVYLWAVVLAVVFSYIFSPGIASAMIVQHGTSTISINSRTVEITLDTPVQVGQSFPMVTCAANFNSPSRVFCRSSLITEVDGKYTQLEVYRGSSGNTAVEVSWQVIENTNFTVQTGTTTIQTATVNIAINEVDLDSAFVLVSAGNNSGHAYNGPIKAKFNSSTEINVSKGNYGSGIYAYTRWYVVEWANSSVQSGNVTLSGASFVNDTISEVDLDKSFLIHSFLTNQTNYPARVFVMGQFASSTSVQFTKDSTSGTNDVSYFVVTHDDISTQRGILEVIGTTATATISSVETSTTFLPMPSMGNGRQSTDTYGFNERYYHTQTLTNATTITVTRLDDTDTLTTYWQAVSVVDSSNPILNSVSPADNASAATTTTNLSLTFDEAVDVESGNVTIKKSSDDSTVEQIDVTSGQVTGSGSITIVVNPSVTLDEKTEYYVIIDATSFDDAAGNSYAGISATSTWNFTTGDFTNPTISVFSPADDATSVALDSNLVITFSESAATSTGNITIKKTSDDSTVEAFNVASSVLITGSGTTYTINPTSDLAYKTNYYVQIDASAFDDTAGNSYAGIANTTSWNFTTADTPIVVEGGNGPIFSGHASAIPGYIAPRMQTVYPDGRIVYLDEEPIKEQTVTETYPVAKPEIPLIVKPETFTNTTFTRYLQRGSIGEEVKRLQEYLNTHGFVLVSSGPGSPGEETDFFGSLTEKALIQFQESHRVEILDPINLKNGSGYFGRMTIRFVNRP